MFSFKMLRPADNPGLVEKEQISRFVMDACVIPSHPIEKQVLWSVDHATSIFPHQGGFIVKMLDGPKQIGIAIVNKTGMENQISEYILSHVALLDDDNELLRLLIDRVKKLSGGTIQSVLDSDQLTLRLKEINSLKSERLQLVSI